MIRGKTLYVGNIPFNATEVDVRAFFGRYLVKTIRFGKFPDGRSRGFCFVDLDVEPTALDEIVETHNKKELGGRKVHLSFAQPRAARRHGTASRCKAADSGKSEGK